MPVGVTIVPTQWSDSLGLVFPSKAGLILASGARRSFQRVRSCPLSFDACDR
jgi:hypothetical protein